MSTRELRAGRGNGAGEEQDAAVDRCGKDTVLSLPADEETLEAVSRGRSEGVCSTAVREKGFEPCEAGRVPAEGCAADPEEVFGNGAGALWTDAGRRSTLADEDGLEVGEETLRRWMLAEGLWSRMRRRKAHRKRRARAGALW